MSWKDAEKGMISYLERELCSVAAHLNLLSISRLLIEPTRADPPTSPLHPRDDPSILSEATGANEDRRPEP